MDDNVRAEALEAGADGRAVADVHALEAVVRPAGGRGEIFQVACVGQGVERQDFRLADRIERQAHESRADEAGAACDQIPHLCCVSQS